MRSVCGAIESMLAQWAHLRSPLAALTYLCVLAASLDLAMLAFSSAMLSSASFGLTAVEVTAAHSQKKSVAW